MIIVPIPVVIVILVLLPAVLGDQTVHNIVMAVRDMHFGKTLRVHKDSSGKIGFEIKEGKIVKIAVDSSAARNGLLTDHNQLEVNGQDFVGIKDKDGWTIIQDCSGVITVTIIPLFIHKHIVKSMACSLVKEMMDHSFPTVTV